MNYEDGGDTLIRVVTEKYPKISDPEFVIKNRKYYFRRSITWSDITISENAFRFCPDGFIFDVCAPSAFFEDGTDYHKVISFLNSNTCSFLTKLLNPTVHFTLGDFKKLPYLAVDVVDYADRCISISKKDWDSYESSWDFSLPWFVRDGTCLKNLHSSYEARRDDWRDTVEEMRGIEFRNNHAFIEAYGVSNVLDPDVPLGGVTLTCNPHYRYGGELTDEEREKRLKSDTMRELVSYAVGCMMGRYSLAEPGLIYAHSGGVGFDPCRYGRFPADDDGIVPLTEEHWFAGDAAARIEEFLGVVWPETPIMETMATLMDGLAMGMAGEPRVALRSYLSKQFYKDHLQTYKCRPIYWLFSSGKQKGFEALVCLHRYNEGTLARMRTVYVTPLMGKLQQRISDLDAEIVASSSSAEKTRKTREKDKLTKQVVELRKFDEELRHLADQRIALNLDDGVKVNYARFGNLLAAKDKVCPKKRGEDE